MRPELQKLNLPLPIAIIGLGLSGESALRLLLAAGVDRSQILTFDQKSPADFQDHINLLIEGKPRTLCVSPGVALKADWIQNALNQGARLTSELEIAFAFLTSEKVIALTGSVGKSTTTSILGAGVSAIDPNAFVGGNLGMPLADYAAGLIEGNRNKAQNVILELSSYQMENFRNLKCDVAVLTHLSANHLERYDSLQHYFDTKIHLFRYATKLGVLNQNGGEISNQIDRITSQNPNLTWKLVDRKDPEFRKRLTTTPNLVGTHNLDNLAMAFAVAENQSWPQESFTAMLRFPGLAHRLENCGRIDDILFLNDSKATSIESVLQAVSSVVGENPNSTLHLLVGGKDKGLPWENLRVSLRYPHLKYYFFGEVGPLAQQKSQLQGPVFAKFGEALKHLKSQLRAGDTVLLSPGGTSWDEFKNFEERGKYFKNWILAEFQSHKR